MDILARRRARGKPKIFQCRCLSVRVSRELSRAGDYGPLGYLFTGVWLDAQVPPQASWPQAERVAPPWRATREFLLATGDLIYLFKRLYDGGLGLATRNPCELDRPDLIWRRPRVEL